MSEACPHCGARRAAGPCCPACGARIDPVATTSDVVAASPRPVRGPRGPLVTSIVAIPAALLLAWLFTLNHGFHFIVSAGGDMPLHELGHATAWWLCGRPAIPFFFVTLMGSPESSLVTLTLVVAGLGALAWWARGRGLGFIWRASAGLALFSVVATFGFSEETARELAIFSGCGGALWWGAALVGAFTLELPEAWRWSSRRWFFLGFGACVFAAALHRWVRGDIPWGAFLGGDGDMDVLRDRYGWTAEGIVAAYRRVAAVCGLGIAVARWRGVRRAWDEWRGEA